MWTLLRKGGTSIHVSHGPGVPSNNLFAHNVRVSVASGAVELSLDLNPNLHANKQTWTYTDARALADRGLAELSLVQLLDDGLLKKLAAVLAHIKPLPRKWILEVELEGTHRFAVTPKLEADLLWLSVNGSEGGDEGQ